MTEDEVPDGYLSDEDWRWVSERMPIACVDILPVVRDETGRLSKIGLIWRGSPMGEKWCHVGGRIQYQDSLYEAARKHLDDSLAGEDLRLQAEPYYVNQFFPVHREGMGYDPRKHAVAACFLAEAEFADPIPTVGGEAKKFLWFDADALPDRDRLWPGTEKMVAKALRQCESRDVLLSLEALNARYLAHNQLMWQTPALAMAAMAFLLTIALSGKEDWMRVIAAMLSTIIGWISAQLLAKHSKGQRQDADELWAIERRRGMLPVHARPEYAELKLVKSLRRRSELIAWFESKRSRDWWLNTMLLFAVVSLAIAGLAVLGI